MSVKWSSKKNLSRIFVGEKAMVPFKVKEKNNKHTRIKDVLDIPKQWYTDLHDTKCLATLFSNSLKKCHLFSINVGNTITSKKIESSLSQLSY